MDKAFFNKLNAYCLAMMQADKMFSCGIISEEEYAIIDTKTADHFGIPSCSIFRGNALIYKAFRGNMSHNLEVRLCPEK